MTDQRPTTPSESETPKLFDGPFDRRPARKPGTSIVAIGAKGAIELASGEGLTWGERVFGRYGEFYLVDMSPKSITETYEVTTKRPAMSFTATVTHDVRICDPKGIVSRGIKSLPSLWSTAVKRRLFEIGKDYSIEEITAATQAMQEALDKLEVDPAIARINVSIHLKADQEAQALLRTVAEQELKTLAIGSKGRVDEVARDQIKKILQSPDDLLAHFLVTKDESFRMAHQQKMDQATSEYDRRMLVIKALIDNKIIEAHDLHERFPDFINEVFRALPSRGWPGPPLLGDASTPQPSNDDKRETPG